nr:Hypothetical protein pJMR5-1_0009 [Clostridioides difficile]VTT91027.1 Hypothetical protein ECE1_0009 [Clostridioides difficile]
MFRFNKDFIRYYLNLFIIILMFVEILILIYSFMISIFKFD